MGKSQRVDAKQGGQNQFFHGVARFKWLSDSGLLCLLQIHAFQAFRNVFSVSEIPHLPKFAAGNPVDFQFFWQPIYASHARFDDSIAAARNTISTIIGGRALKLFAHLSIHFLIIKQF